MNHRIQLRGVTTIRTPHNTCDWQCEPPTTEDVATRVCMIHSKVVSSKLHVEARVNICLGRLHLEASELKTIVGVNWHSVCQY